LIGPFVDHQLGILGDVPEDSFVVTAESRRAVAIQG
jgi:hypothetical protein